MPKILLTVAVIGLAMLTASEAFAGPFGLFGRRNRAPAAPATTAVAPGGYRTYSYEPGMAPAGTDRARARAARAPYLDATSKVNGRSYNW